MTDDSRGLEPLGYEHAPYGRPFADVLARPPSSAFLAEGSPIAVHRPARIAT